MSFRDFIIGALIMVVGMTSGPQIIRSFGQYPNGTYLSSSGICPSLSTPSFSYPSQNFDSSGTGGSYGLDSPSYEFHQSEPVWQYPATEIYDI